MIEALVPKCFTPTKEAEHKLPINSARHLHYIITRKGLKYLFIMQKVGRIIVLMSRKVTTILLVRMDAQLFKIIHRCLMT